METSMKKITINFNDGTTWKMVDRIVDFLSIFFNLIHVVVVMEVEETNAEEG